MIGRNQNFDREEHVLFKIKFDLPSFESSGLLLVIVSIHKPKLADLFHVIISTSELYDVDLKQELIDLIDLINNAPEIHPINSIYNNKIKTSWNDFFSDKDSMICIKHFIDEEMLVINNLFINFLKSVLDVSKIDLISEAKVVRINEYEEVQLLKGINDLSLNEKIAKVSNYVDSTETAQKIIRSNSKDMAILKFTFKNSMDNKGAGIVLYNLYQKKISYELFVFLSKAAEFNKKSDSSLFDFYSALKFFEEKKENFDNNSAEKFKLINSRIKEETLYQVFQLNNDENIKLYLKQVLNKIAGEIIELDFHKNMKSFLEIELLLKLHEAKNEDINLEIEDKMDDDSLIIDAAPVLSPARGTALSELNKGDEVYMSLDSSNPVAYKILYEADLIEKEKVKPIVGVVDSVEYDAENKIYTLLVRLTANVYCKSEEEDNIRVRIANVIDESEDEEISTNEKKNFILIIFFLIIFLIIVIFILKKL